MRKNKSNSHWKTYTLDEFATKFDLCTNTDKHKVLQDKFYEFAKKEHNKELFQVYSKAVCDYLKIKEKDIVNESSLAYHDWNEYMLGYIEFGDSLYREMAYRYMKEEKVQAISQKQFENIKKQWLSDKDTFDSFKDKLDDFIVDNK